MLSGRNASFAAVLFTAFSAITLVLAAPLNGQQRKTLATELSAPESIKAVGRLPGSQRLNLAITLPLRNQEQLQTLLHDLYDPTSPNYRHFLTVEEFTERFGPTAEDYERVASFARTNGLAVTHTAPNRLVLDVSGAASDVEQAFHVIMHVYQHPTESRTFYAPDVEPSVDASLPVQGISGLSTFAPPRPASLHRGVSNLGVLANTNGPELTGSGPGGELIGSDLRAAYAPGVTLDGTGQAVGLFEGDGYNLSDIQLYFTTVNQPLNVPIINVLVDGVSGTCGTGCDDSEEALDIEAAISMAPNLSALLVYEGEYQTDILNQMATDNIAKQLSESYVGPHEPASDDPIFEEFAAQGQSFFASSGDGGAYGPPSCTSSCWQTNFPADDPNVTAVGGTELTTSGPGGTWQSETSWPLSGGGINSYGVAIPSYQIPVINSLNQGSTTLRNIPDVAADAAGMYDCANGKCVGAGGTSLSAPLWVGFLALANQYADGTPIGFLNPPVYQIAQGTSYASDFHDITTGNNFDVNSPALFSAVTGYDLVTGVGTPNGQSLISALSPAHTGPNFTLIATPGTLQVSQGSPQTTAISIQAANGFSGTVNLTAAVLGQPTGVTASLSAASVSGAASSTLTVSTTSLNSVPSVQIAVTGTSSGLTHSVYINTTVLLPNLVETAVSAPPASVKAGAGFSVTDTVENNGQASAGASVTRYYLSATATRTSSSILLAGSRAVPQLAAGATSTGTLNVTVPAILWTSGGYYLLACADDTGTVGEASTGNCVASTTTVAINQAQLSTITTLAVTSAGNQITSVSSGSVVTLTAAVVGGNAPVTTGQVNFCDASAKYCADIHLLGTAQLTSKGIATLSFVPSIGSHTYNAVFVGKVSGGGIETASTSGTATLIVSGTYPTTTAIAESGSVGNYTLSATVTSLEGPVSPTGLVSFIDTSNGNAALGTSSLNAGASELNWLDSQAQAGGFPEAIAVGDFNGDGIPDLAVAIYQSSQVTILLGNGDGTFTAVAGPTVGIGPMAIAVGDFNGDGIPDLAVANQSSDTVSILLGNGNGTFTAISSPATGSAPFTIKIGDFNNDGIPDLAVGNGNGNSVTILLGNGDGTFTSASEAIPLGNTFGTIYCLAVGDFNGDGKADLVIGVDYAFAVFLGNGDGTFVQKGNLVRVSFPYGIAVADLNGDGKADLAALSAGYENVAIFMGNGDGTFTAAGVTPATGFIPHSITVGNFSGSGNADLAVANEGSNTVTIFTGNGDGTFNTVADSPATGSEPFAIARGNFNGDGDEDLAVIGNSKLVTVLTRQLVQTGTATLTGASPVGSGTHQVDASYPGDNNYSSSVSGTIGLTAVVKVTPMVTVTPGSSSITTAQALSVTVMVSGGSGSPTATGAVTLTSGTYTSAATTLSGGSATINIPAGSLAAGGDKLTATYAPDSTGSSTYNSATGTATVTVTIAPNFTLSASPMTLSVAQGGNGTTTITVTDVGGFAGNISLSASGLPSGVTASFAAGSTAGTQVLTLTASTSATVTSAPVTITITGTSGTLSATTSIALTITAEPSFTAGSGGTTSITLTPGATTGNTGTISVVGTNGFSGTVSLTCAITSSPTGANDPPTCSLKPTSVTLSGTATQTSTLTVTTTAASSAENQMRKLFWPSTGGTALALILLFFVPRRQRNWLAMLSLLLLFVSFGALGCGGGGGSGGGGGGGGGNTGTTTGTYTITVTGTSGSLTATVGTVTLTVQ